MPLLRTRIYVSAIIALASGFYCWLLMMRLDQGAGDFVWAIRVAQDLLAEQNPYHSPSQLYPLPSGFFGLPFIWTPPAIAGGIFYGVSSGLLAFGLTRYGFYRLLIFLAYPYWAGMLTVQWAPIIMASAFLPWLFPATLAKPQIGLPVAVTHLSRTGMYAGIIAVAVSVLVKPNWPLLWFHQLGGYSRFIPLLVIPGPLLAMALLRYRERDAWLLFCAACMPQRWFYDPFTLWLIPTTRWEILTTVTLSWIPGIWRWYHFPNSFIEVGRWTVLWIYLPMLAVVLLRQCKRPDEASSHTGDCAIKSQTVS